MLVRFGVQGYWKATSVPVCGDGVTTFAVVQYNAALVRATNISVAPPGWLLPAGRFLKGQVLKLYQIADSLLEVFSKMDGLEDGQMTPEIMAELDALNQSFEQKMAGCIAVVSELNADAEMIDKEVRRLQDRQKACLRKAIGLKEYMRSCMESLGEKSVDVAGKWTVRIQNSPASVNIIDAEKIPPEYVVTKTERIVSKAKIAEDLKAGTDVPGAELVTNTTLRIY